MMGSVCPNVSRSSWQTSYPVMPGMLTSSSTRPKRVVAVRASASSPGPLPRAGRIRFVRAGRRSAHGKRRRLRRRAPACPWPVAQPQRARWYHAAQWRSRVEERLLRCSSSSCCQRAVRKIKQRPSGRQVFPRLYADRHRFSWTNGHLESCSSGGIGHQRGPLGRGSSRGAERPLGRARPIAEEDYPISQCPDRGMPSSVVVSRPGRTGNQVCMRVRSIGFFVLAGVEAATSR